MLLREGIGLATALRLIKNGCHVIAVDMQESSLTKLAADSVQLYYKWEKIQHLYMNNSNKETCKPCDQWSSCQYCLLLDWCITGDTGGCGFGWLGAHAHCNWGRARRPTGQLSRELRFHAKNGSFRRANGSKSGSVWISQYSYLSFL